ncbi:uncharacterized protein LOC129917129 isoform X1 [Episyrphus balteatus]|uniref:uncharacterized protein LOC129917129 isoform X1 n=1 Tax=Episyrphus balteatus TaxID=286459 RepID=UPI002486011E|nr:uncharacterized protein LOC129917129 isoform X1 [Episyrphus balteatus]
MNHHKIIVMSKLLQRTCLSSLNYTAAAEIHSNNVTTTTSFSRQQRLSLSSSQIQSIPLRNSDSMTTAFACKRFYSKFSSQQHPTTSLGAVPPLCEEKAYELVLALKDAERSSLKMALDKYDALKLKEGFEGKLAATQWRTKFGRLSRVPTPLSNVDPTGSFCTFPEDWLKRKAAEKAQPPSSSDLYKIFFVNAVPFVVFGFLDNFCMIMAGDYIEQVCGAFMCISTMAAAGLGNTISDILGIGTAFYVERFCAFLGLRPPDLVPIQMEMKESRRAANSGRIIGITIGCLLGMFPLLFLNNEKSEETDQSANPVATVI